MNSVRSASRSRGSFLLLCVAVAPAAIAASACSSSSGAPAVLSDCTATDDAACAANPAGGGGGSSSGGSGDSGTTTQDAGGEPGDAGTCGTAGSILNAANNQCPVCISASCCLAAAACTGQCVQLLSCTSGINSCEASYPQGVGAYNDLAACLVQSCATQCPTLPTATAGDI